MISKAKLKAELVAQLEAQLATARSAHGSAMAGAVDDEARPENDKDTRGLEQSYLARGHAQRVAELEIAIAVTTKLALRQLDDDAAVALTALVEVEEGARPRTLWIAPHGGGLTLSGDVTVVTPSSPLGRALLGRHVDDTIELGPRKLTITGVR